MESPCIRRLFFNEFPGRLVSEYRSAWSAAISVNDIIEAHTVKVDIANIKYLKSKGYDARGIKKYILSRIALQ